MVFRILIILFTVFCLIVIKFFGTAAFCHCAMLRIWYPVLCTNIFGFFFQFIYILSDKEKCPYYICLYVFPFILCSFDFYELYKDVRSLSLMIRKKLRKWRLDHSHTRTKNPNHVKNNSICTLNQVLQTRGVRRRAPAQSPPKKVRRRRRK